MTPADLRVVVATGPNPGAIGVVQVFGSGVAGLLQSLTGIDVWRPGRLRMADFADIDQGVAVLLRDDWAQLMPHGGPRVMRKLVDRVIELGAEYAPNPPARQMYPEAESDCEAEMLALLAKAASPAAVDLLLAQPGLWRQWARQPAEDSAAILARSDRWDRLVEPPAVVVVGRPNVGKSTLANQMLGRAASVVADLPGTTRDWVAGLAELGPPELAVAVRWLDTPGLRRSDDPIEQGAIELARRATEQAAVVIALCDADSGWPGPAELPRQPDLWVQNKVDVEPADRGRGERAGPLLISALHGSGIGCLEELVRRKLGLDDAEDPALWAFSPTLRAAADKADTAAMRGYLGI